MLLTKVISALVYLLAFHIDLKIILSQPHVLLQREQYQSKEEFAMKTAIEVEQMQLKAEKLRQEVIPSA